VTGLAARVMWAYPDGAIMPRSHMLLRVDLDDQPYLADVGFGGLTLTGPLRLVLNSEQETSHETFRLIEADESYVMQAHVGGRWHSLYRFTLERQFLADYQVTNWYLSNHPESRFVVGLIAARVAPGRRYALRNTEFVVHELRGSTERRALTSVGELRETLEQVFGIAVPVGDEVDAAFDVLCRR
jgi:N-hydroxyarylamine O-acetyltransferase